MERSDMDRSERDVTRRDAPGGAHQITAIPELLEMLNLKGAVVTIDAMGTQRAIAGRIVDKGSDYILSVKGNQGWLHDETRQIMVCHEVGGMDPNVRGEWNTSPA